MEIRKRFNLRTKEEGGCLIWIGGKTVNKIPYGMFYVEGKMVLAHRFSYEYHKGKIPKGLQVCHSCDKSLCVNPNHLWVGTQKQNVQDMIKKGRRVVGDNRGEKHGRSKLTWDAVHKIRHLYKRRIVTQKYLANKFGITRGNIGFILKEKTWKS